MTSKLLAALPLALTFALAACGGGGGESITTQPTTGKFNTTDDAGAAIGLASGAFEALGEGLSSTDSKSTAKRSVKAKARAKATTTQNCESGSVSFTTDDATVFADDGQTTASSCRFSFTEGSSSGAVSFNGRYTDRCTDSAQTSSSCVAYTARIADGASGGATLDFASSGTDSDGRYDFELKIKGDTVERFTSTSDDVLVNGSLSFNDKAEGLTGNVGFENFRSVFTQTSSGATETVNGAITIATSNSKCSIGRVTVRTDNALTYDSNDNTIAGQLTLTDSTGGTARVNYNSDGSVTVTLANGQTRTYTEVQLEDLC